MVDKQTVKKVAELARLHLSEEELISFTSQLSSIVETFQAISEVPTEGVEPMLTPTEIQSGLRDDGREEHYNVEDLLANAPEKMGSLVRVPPVV